MKFDLSRLRLFTAALGVAALTSTVALSQSSYPNKPIRILVGFAPGGPSDIISPALGVKSVAELVKLAKEKPGVLQYATAGRGSATHLTSELFNMAAGIKTTAVHYRGGGDTIKDLLSGEVKMMFSSIAPVQDF